MKKLPEIPGLVIIGAGFAGLSLAREIHRKNLGMNVQAFVDDDPGKINTTLEGIPVLGPIKDIKKLGLKAETAIIAIPSATKGQLQEIYQDLLDAQILKVKILPAVSQIVEGEAHLVLTRELDLQDLLGRNPVQINLKASLKYLRGKRVLITGAGGSIGSELCRQLLSGGAERLYLLGHEENSIYHIEKELRHLQAEGVGEKATIVPIIGDLKDPHYLDFLLGRLKAHVIFHTAAHKHVPMVEYNPVEAVFNNVWGTKNLVDAALKARVSRFVLISTDKAVNPNSIYGATKRICEDLVLSARGPDSEFMVVRFGNVLGSRGSIIPLFKEQILSGGPVTITHPQMSRYFMTIPEAASLVLQTGGVGQNGQLYLLDMGDPVKIEDLAHQMIRFYGRAPGKDIPITYTGLRPGEKLHESLHGQDEQPVPTEYTRINRLIRPVSPPGLDTLVQKLFPICHFLPQYPDLFRSRKALRAAIREYLPSVETQDNEPEY